MAGWIEACFAEASALRSRLDGLSLTGDMRLDPLRAGAIPTRPNCRQARSGVLRPVSRKAKAFLKSGRRLPWPEGGRSRLCRVGTAAHSLTSRKTRRGLRRRTCEGMCAGGVRGGSLNIALRTPLNRAPAHPPFGACRQIIPRLRNRRGPITASHCRCRARKRF